ncbi:DUF4259 domain-containing protein [Paucibacter sp. O1-1]|nr:DUF4259 domain-containing protein [Paucibacter sp. O1-1]MDA3826631.1 DUF4259 domain-containing protein [Paucibacter sp. O1-1]
MKPAGSDDKAVIRVNLTELAAQIELGRVAGAAALLALGRNAMSFAPLTESSATQQREMAMGTWGPAAWDNDSAADWFADMFEETGLAEFVQRTLEQDPEDSPDEIRAAAHVLVALGRTYIWPVDQLDDHLKLAIARLETIKAMYSEESPDFEHTIDDELASLRAALGAN